MNKFKIKIGAVAFALISVAIVACNKEKTEQLGTSEDQLPAYARDYTLAEMAEAMSWEEGKAFIENQPIKDYTYLYDDEWNDCGGNEKGLGIPYYISWELRMPNGSCNPNYGGSCIVIRPKDNPSTQPNAIGYFENDKLIIIPTTEEDGFTADGYLVIGAPIEVQNDSIVIQEGIYAACYDEGKGKYSAVVVDYYLFH